MTRISLIKLIEDYQKYSDYKNKSYGTPEDLKKDLLIVLHRLIPDKLGKEKYIEKITDKSIPTKGIKFEVKLKSNDIIHAYKIGQWSGDWELYLNGNKSNKYKISEYLEDKAYTPYEKWQMYYNGSDKNFMYADDRESYKRGMEQVEYAAELYDKLNTNDKKKADAYMKIHK